MKKFGLALILFFLSYQPVFGLVIKPSPEPRTKEMTETATKSGILSIEQLAEKELSEQREPTAADKLKFFILQKSPGEMSWHNFLQYSIREAVARGVAANTIVSVLLFPLIAGLIAAARHIIGLTGFGIFVPAMLSVAFMATGLRTGLILLAIIWLAASWGRKLTQKLKLQYLPRLALLMWLVSLGVLIVMLGGIKLNFKDISAISIFPIMILMLLSENFIEVQTGKSRHEALRIMLQTMIMAIVGTLVLRADGVQKFVLSNPEIYLLLVAVLDIFVGKYTGLRVLEIFKFKKLLK
jgi:hypothetical protein